MVVIPGREDVESSSSANCCIYFVSTLKTKHAMSSDCGVSPLRVGVSARRSPMVDCGKTFLMLKPGTQCKHQSVAIGQIAESQVFGRDFLPFAAPKAFTELISNKCTYRCR